MALRAKASGFLAVRPEFQNEVHPTIISHAYNRPRSGRSQFLAEFDWMGTHDPTPLLSLPSAIEFLGNLHNGGIDALMQQNRELALRSQAMLSDALEIAPPCPAAMIGSMVSVPLVGVDRVGAESLARDLFDRHRIEVPIFSGVTDRTGSDRAGSSETGSGDAGSGDAAPLLRVSLQAYNDIGQVERLADILRRLQ